MKLITSAESFGYGPASKLHAICAELVRRGAECHFLGHDVALTFARSNPGAYASVTPVESLVELARVQPGEFTAALSVMDPFLVAWAAYHRLPCLYVDSLYWLWDWTDMSEEDFQAEADAITGAASAEDALRGLEALTLHQRQYVAHHLSTTTCAQRTPAASARAESLRAHGDVRTVEAIVDLTHRAPARPDSWLVTTSGLLSPLVPIDLAVSWVRSACALVDGAATAGGCDEPMVLTGNPEVLARARPLLPARFDAVPLDHDAILGQLNRSIACLTPPGLTTILEASAYRTPVVFLPEQHYAHLANYELVTPEGAPPRYREALMNKRADRSADGDIDTETKALIALLESHRVDRTSTWTAMVGSLADGMVEARAHRARVADAQREVVHRLFGGEAGTEQVCATLAAVL